MPAKEKRRRKRYRNGYWCKELVQRSLLREGTRIGCMREGGVPECGQGEEEEPEQKRGLVDGWLGHILLPWRRGSHYCVSVEGPREEQREQEQKKMLVVG